jgi:hypothetical protein
MKTRTLLALLALPLLLLTGCVTPPKPYYVDANAVTASTHKPIYLLSVTLRNEYKPGHPFNYYSFNIERLKPIVPAANDPQPFGMTATTRMTEEHGGSSYFIVIQALPGQAINLRGVDCACEVDYAYTTVLHGTLFAPFFIVVPGKTSGVWYLGHIDAFVREGGKGAFAAGPIVPILDQVTVGASTGTWYIATSDKWKDDAEVFNVMFPALKGAQVQMALLPPFDKKRVQIWWDKCITYGGFVKGPGK